MNKAIIFITLFLTFSITVFGQNIPNYSGGWMLDMSKSKVYQGMPFPAMTKSIKQSAEKIEIINDEAIEAVTEKELEPIIYSLDGSENSKEIETSKGKMFVVYRSGFNKENNLEITRKQKINDQIDEAETLITEIWELADDGKTLKIKNMVSGQSGENISEIVFFKNSSESYFQLSKKDRKSQGIINGRALQLIKPGYPQDAQKAKAQGNVYIEVLIDEKGNVFLAKAIYGHPLLLATSEEAARLCKFTPTKVKGLPVKVSGIIAYNFEKM